MCATALGAGGAVECVGSMTIDASPAMNRETKCPERHYVPVDDKSTNKQTNKHHKIYKDTKGHRVYLQDEETAWRESVLRRQTLTDMTCSGSFFVYKICYIRCVAGWWPDKQSNTNRHRTAPSKNALLEKKTSRPIYGATPFLVLFGFVFFFIGRSEKHGLTSDVFGQ